MALNKQTILNGEQDKQAMNRPHVPLKPTKLLQPTKVTNSTPASQKPRPTHAQSVSNDRLANCEAALQALSNVIKNCPGNYFYYHSQSGGNDQRIE